MHYSRFSAILTAAVLIGFGSIPANSQNLGVTDILSGNTVPLTLALKDLDSNWRVISITEHSGTEGYASVLKTMYGGSAENTYYTAGKNITVGGDIYLIAYRWEAKKPDFMTIMGGNSENIPKQETLTQDTKLQLSVLNLHTIQGLTNIHPFDLQREVAASEADSKSFTDYVIRRSPYSDPARNIQQVSFGMIQYLQDHDEKFPSMKDPVAVKKLILPYVKSEKAFYQPGTEILYQPNSILSNHKLSQISAPSTMVMFYESKPDKNGMREVVFVDGNLKQVSADEWVKIKKASKIP